MFILPHLCDNFNIYQSVIVSLLSTTSSEEKKGILNDESICFSTFLML